MHEFDPDILRVRIRQLRQDQGETQRQFSKKIGASSVANIQHWEAGDRTPSAYSLFQIASCYNVHVDWLLGLTDERGRPMEPLYEVVVADPVSGLEVQRSDLHTWEECEDVYFAYSEDYPMARIMIVLAE